MTRAYHHRSIPFILLILLGLCSTTGELKAAFSHHPDRPWFTLNTANFDIHFQQGSELQAKTVAKICEQVHKNLTAYFDWTPSKATQVVIISQSDIANGSAIPIPHNTMNLYMTPSDDVGSDYQSWLEHLITHEYTHILHIDKAIALPFNLRDLFGRMSLLFPNALQPVWVIEGYATYKETDREHGYGRGQSTLFNMFMRTETEQGLKPIEQVNIPFSSWPSGTTRYLYGVYFFNFLHDTYGEKKIKSWINGYSDNILPFSINSTAIHIFQKNMFELWKDFEKYLNKNFSVIKQDIVEKGIIEGERITSSAYYTGHPQVASNGDIYYVKNDLLQQAKLMLLRNRSNNASAIMEIRSSQFDVHATKGIVLSELDFIDNVEPYYDLYIAKPDGTEKRQITTAGRYKYPSWHPTEEKILAVQQAQTGQSLQLLSISGKPLKTLWKTTDTTLITHPKWSPSGESIVAAVWRRDTKWNLEIFDIGRGKWSKLTYSNNIESQPKFSADGRQVRFIADYGHTYNFYTINLQSKKIEQLSNVTTGMLAGDYSQSENAIYYMGLNDIGFDLYRLNLAEHSPLKVQTTPFEPDNTSSTSVTPTMSDTTPDITSNDSIRPYNPLPYIAPTFWIPHIFIEKDRNELGIITGGSDPLYRHQYAVTGAYDTKNNWTIGRLDYIYDRYDPSVKLTTQRLVTIERDNNGVAQRFINEDESAIELLFPYLKRDRQWVFHLGWVNNSIKERKTVTGPPTIAKITDDLVGVALSVNTSKSFQRSISPVSGSRIRLVAEDNDTFDNVYSGQTYQLDWRKYISLTDTHVLASRLLIGWGVESPRPFRLGDHRGGFGFVHPAQSLIVPTGQVFNTRSYALRGYKNTPALTNRHLLLAETEWRFPITSIDRTVSTPPIGINRIHGRLFYNVGETTAGHFNSSGLLHGAGFEVISEILILYGIPLNLRLGFAHGFNDGGESEWYATLGNTF